MVPGMIMLLIEIHCFPMREQLRGLNDSDASTSWVEQLLLADLIEYTKRQPPDNAREYSPFDTTEKGKKHIENLTDLPLPTRTWI